MTNHAFINGKLFDPITKSGTATNLLLSHGKLMGLGYLPDEEEENLTIIDLAGKWIIPNITDAYCNVREPGDDSRETLFTAAKAAKQGGITRLLTCPATAQTVDTPEAMRYVNEEIHDISKVLVSPIGAITKKTKGEELAEMGLMRGEGAVAFADDKLVENPRLMINALRYSSMFKTPLIVRPYDSRVSDGQMNEGHLSSILGLRGIPVSAETTVISRDIDLVRDYGGSVVFFPVTTARSLTLIREARKEGLSIYAGTAPQYLMLDETVMEQYDPNTKVMPPLRSKADQAALIAGITDGTISFIASDHQPLSVEEKQADFVTSIPGISGLDTFLGLVIDTLHHHHKLPIEQIAPLISSNLADIFPIGFAKMGLNSPVSFTVVDPDQEWTVQVSDIKSAGKNTPFVGRTLKGRAMYTVVEGKLVFKR